MNETVSFKKGDKVLMKECNNGNYPAWTGVPLEVVSVYQSGYIVVKQINGSSTGTLNLYTDTRQTGRADVVVYASRIEQATYLEKKIADMKAEVEKTEEEIERLRKYKDDEEEVAAKLNSILKAKGPKQIAEILRTLKQSNYL